MADILVAEDFTSQDIRNKIDETYLLKGDYYLQELYERNGVPEENRPEPADVSFTTKNVLICYVSMIVARDRISLTHRQALEGADSDPWEKLYNIYKKDLSEKLAGISAESLSNGTYNLDGAVGTIRRGGALL